MEQVGTLQLDNQTENSIDKWYSSGHYENTNHQKSFLKQKKKQKLKYLSTLKCIIIQNVYTSAIIFGRLIRFTRSSMLLNCKFNFCT